MKLLDFNKKHSKLVNDLIGSKYGYSIDYNNLTESKARKMLENINKNLTLYKAKNGHLNSERNPHYSQMMLIKDGITNWLTENVQTFESKPMKEDVKKDKKTKGSDPKMKKESINLNALRRAVELSESTDRVPSRYLAGLQSLIKLAESHPTRFNRLLAEGEVEQAQAILAARDMVNTIQDMIETFGKMINEDLPPLLDTIRDQIGSEQANSFNSEVSNALSQALENAKTSRQAVDNATRALAGEQQEQPIGGISAPAAGNAMPPDQGSELDAELDTVDDGMGATDAAAGGTHNMGRARR